MKWIQYLYYAGEVLCELERYPEAMAHYDEMALLFPASRAEIAAARQASFSMMEQSVAKRLRAYSCEPLSPAAVEREPNATNLDSVVSSKKKRRRFSFNCIFQR